jgi:hypothetical protein
MDGGVDDARRTPPLRGGTARDDRRKNASQEK